MTRPGQTSLSYSKNTSDEIIFERMPAGQLTMKLLIGNTSDFSNSKKSRCRISRIRCT